MDSYQVHLDGLLPVLLIVDAGVVDDDVQTSKLVHGLLEGICPHKQTPRTGSRLRFWIRSRQSLLFQSELKINSGTVFQHRSVNDHKH